MSDLNTLISVVLYVLLGLSAVTLVLFVIYLVMRAAASPKAATPKSILAWLGGVTAVASFCVSALNFFSPIGVLPDKDPAVVAIKNYYEAIQSRRCEDAWALIHTGRKKTIAEQYHGFGLNQFCEAYRTTKTYENLQITRKQDTTGLSSSRIYRVSYDVYDEFPINTFYQVVYRRLVQDALRGGELSEKTLLSGVILNTKRYYVVPEKAEAQIREVIRSVPISSVFSPELIYEIKRLLKLNYSIDLQDQNTAPPRQQVKRHFVHSLILTREDDEWKIRDGLANPELIAPYGSLEKVL